MSACQDQINAVQNSNKVFPKSKEDFKIRTYICLIFNKLTKTCKSIKRKYLTERYPSLCSNIEAAHSFLEDEANPEHAYVCDGEEGNQFWHGDHLEKDLQQDLEDDLYLYTKQNIVMANIMTKDLTVTQIMKDEKTSTISFIANTGGLMGLCIGLSSVSIFEIIYHVLTFIFSKIRGSKGKVQQSNESDSRY